MVGRIDLIPDPALFLKMHFLWLNAPAGILREAGFWIDKHLNGLEENGPGPGVSRYQLLDQHMETEFGGIPFRYAYLFLSAGYQGPGHVPPGLPDRRELPV